jgi:hypothetical protein
MTDCKGNKNFTKKRILANKPSIYYQIVHRK